MKQIHTNEMKRSRKILIILFTALGALSLITVFALLYGVTKDAVLKDELLPGESTKMVIYDQDNEPIEDEDYARFEEISPYIVKAFIAIEDKRFYKHHGIDLYRVVGAAIADLKNGSFKQGGSTISCQLVKNTHLNNEKTLKRKIQEGKIALELERKYTKNEIMEMYLNKIYFGKGIYGIKNACRMLYDKTTSEVTLAEAASLAATVANPKKYSILLNPSNNHERRKLVLKEMKGLSLISDAEFDCSINENIIINYGESCNNYLESYRNLVYSEVKSALSSSSKQFEETEYRVYTNLDRKAQKTVYNALSDKSNDFDKEILLADNVRHGIIAYYTTSDIVRSKRQPGSVLKPFIYATAIENGRIIPESPMLDQPIDINGYSPSNYKNTYSGWISAKEALSSSSNAISVNLLNEIGIDNGFYSIQSAGIPLDKKDKTLALALGGTTYGSSTMDIATGYMTLACGGKSHPLSTIRKITNKNGATIYISSSVSRRVFSEECTYLTTEMLQECARNGTAKQLSYLSIPIAAKTGTVAKGDGNADAWCAGYTHDHTFVCRYSAKDSCTMPSSVTGGNLPTKSIRACLKNLYQIESPDDFIIPIGLKRASISTHIRDKYHKLALAETWDTDAKTEVFTTGNYRFEKIDPNQLFLDEFHVHKTRNLLAITFNPTENIDYCVKVNGKACLYFEDKYLAKRGRFPLVKLEIECLSEGKRVYKRSELIRI